MSQPARMRCGKEETLGRMEAAVRVATRTNALWQSRCCKPRRTAIQSRNPRECAVAKGSELRRLIGRTCRNPRECAEAKLR